MKIYFQILFFLCSYSLLGQDTNWIARENQLNQHLVALRQASTDQEKFERNSAFKKELLEAIQTKGAFEYPFSQLKSIGSITSPDSKFRFFNWNIELEDQTNQYFCFILKKADRGTDMEIIELIDNSITLPKKPDDILQENQWYGALYYKIIPVEKSGKTYYTILGLDAHNAISTVKIIDVLYFSGKHARLGNALFKTKKGTEKRVFFEYSKRAVMSLNYDDERNRIVFDHLSPESPGMEEFPEYHVPDMSLDAFVWQKNKWVLQEDVIGVNQQTNKTRNKVYYIDEKTGETKEITIKNKWIDPSNPDAPAGGNTHTAAMPNQEEAPDEVKEKKEKSKTDKIKKTKENEFSMTPTVATGGKKKKRKR